jgi:integrase
VQNPTYLERSRHGVFYVRWPIPKRFHPAGKMSSVKVSLATREPREALRLARHLGYWADIYMSSGMVAGMRFDEMRGSLAQWFQTRLQRDRERIAERGRFEPEHVDGLRSELGFAEWAVKLGTDLYADIPGLKTDAEIIAGYAERNGHTLTAGTKAFDMFRAEFHRAYRDYCKASLDLDQSFDTFDFAVAPQPSALSNDPLKSMVPLNEIVRKFIDEEMRAGRWVERSESQKRQYFELLQEILGSDRDAGTIKPIDAQNVKNVLLKYPKNRNKKAETKDLPIALLIELNGIETLSIRTVNTYLQTYGTLFGWAKRNGYVAENVFDGVTIKENKRTSEAGRDAYSPDQLRAILHELHTNERGLINKDYQKWGPLIAIYTGARLNEISQLQLDDIKQHNDIWCFDFNDEGDGKKLKTAASRRLVPVHSQLIDLGILEYVDRLRAVKKPRFFHELTLTAKEGYGRNLGRWVNEKLLTTLDFKSKELVFHSFRHTMVTRLMHAGVEENIVKAVVGHTRQGVTQQHYFRQGYTVTQLRAAIEKF